VVAAAARRCCPGGHGAASRLGGRLCRRRPARRRTCRAALPVPGRGASRAVLGRRLPAEPVRPAVLRAGPPRAAGGPADHEPVVGGGQAQPGRGRASARRAQGGLASLGTLRAAAGHRCSAWQHALPYPGRGPAPGLRSPSGCWSGARIRCRCSSRSTTTSRAGRWQSGCQASLTSGRFPTLGARKQGGIPSVTRSCARPPHRQAGPQATGPCAPVTLTRTLSRSEKTRPPRLEAEMRSRQLRALSAVLRWGTVAQELVPTSHHR
jgi:hypothetical protein